MYECEIVLHREKNIDWGCQNRLQSKIFGPNSNEVTEHRINLHNEDVYNMYALPNIIVVIISTS
jgi:hypothetical protein